MKSTGTFLLYYLKDLFTNLQQLLNVWMHFTVFQVHASWTLQDLIPLQKSSYDLQFEVLIYNYKVPP